MPRLNDPADVAQEYACERGLISRRSLYDRLDGEDVQEVLVQTVLAHRPGKVLEVGPGTGELAARLVDAGVSDCVTVDVSPRMVELTRARGLAAELGDVQALPFAAAAFDCVVAAWMLYHVPELDLGLSEIARVLRPGGCLIAVTNSVHHLEELWSLVSHERWETPFNAENGREILSRHFAAVEVRALEGWITLADREAARSYIAASPTRAHLAGRVPSLPGPVRVGARTCIFVAGKDA